MTSERKEAIREYKRRKPSRGIFAVRCAATGEVWVDATPTLDTAQNRHWFSLRCGNHRNTRLQAAWHEHGEQAFQFEPVDELDEDFPELMVADELKKRKQHWIAQLHATAL
jgi:hypothetical protein